MNIDSKQGLLSLIGMNRRLLLQHLKLNVENGSLVSTIAQLRELLYHFQNELAALVSLDDFKLREALHEVQDEIEKEQLAELHKLLKEAQRHIEHCYNQALNRLHTLSNYLHALQHYLNELQAKYNAKTFTLKKTSEEEGEAHSTSLTLTQNILRRNNELCDAFHQSAREALDLRDYLSQFNANLEKKKLQHHCNNLLAHTVAAQATLTLNTFGTVSQELERHRMQLIYIFGATSPLLHGLRTTYSKDALLAKELKHELQAVKDITQHHAFQLKPQPFPQGKG